MQLQHPSPFGASWKARWIWHEWPSIHAETATRPVLSNPVDTIAMFRRVVQVDVLPESAPTRLWIDGRYVLRVNGTEVGRGPVRAEPRAARYDVVDLAPFLRVGPNVISIIGRHFGAATSWWMPVPPSYSLGAGSLVFEARIGDEWIVSDRQWRALRCEAWSPVPVPGDVACLPLESFDARAFPSAWESADFDDSAWSRAVEIKAVHTGSHAEASPPTEPFGMLRPPVRSVFPDGAIHQATLVGEMRVSAADETLDPVRQVLDDQRTARDPSVEPGAQITALRYDLGRIAAGTVQLRVEGAAPGTVIDIAAAEHVDGDGWLVPLGQHAGLRYVCAGDDVAHFESFDIIGTRHLHASVRVPDGQQPPTIGVAIHDRHRPRPAGASFECSDPALNRIYEIGLRTVDVCALDAYVDCPTREQRAWTGDSVVHQMVDLVANPDWSMARWHPQLAAAPRADGMLAMAVASDFAADDRTFVPDWSLHWVKSVHNLYRYDGDRAVIEELLPVAERTLRWFESYLGPNGLLDNVSGWVLLDWASVYSSGCSSTLNALWARGLEQFSEMSRWIGNDGSARWADTRREAVRAAFDAFWDDERGVYVDHIVDGVRATAAAQHGGAAALAAGIVPSQRIDRVVSALIDRNRLVRHSFVMDPVTPTGGSDGYHWLVIGYPEPTWDANTQMVEAEPFFRYVVHEGIARAGRADLIADLCRDWQAFVDRGESTWPECWTGGTRCHGWSSTPSFDLVTHTLGIAPASPGYESVRVTPNLGDLEWARAVVPTPYGPISVEARADGTLQIDSPVPVVS